MQRPKTPWWVLVFAVPFILLMADLGPTQQTLQNMSKHAATATVGLQLPVDNHHPGWQCDDGELRPV